MIKLKNLLLWIEKYSLYYNAFSHVRVYIAGRSFSSSERQRAIRKKSYSSNWCLLKTTL